MAKPVTHPIVAKDTLELVGLGFLPPWHLLSLPIAFISVLVLLRRRIRHLGYDVLEEVKDGVLEDGLF